MSSLLMRGSLLVTLLSLLSSAHAEATWTDNFHDARVLAKKERRPILANFTGSDWSDWSIKLKEQVFETKEFRSWAADHVVLMEIDFPKNKAIATETKKQNAELAQKYGVEAFPTVLILDADGNKIGELRYEAVGAKVWIKKCEEVIKKK
jgi:thioredoxin-related protein